MKSTMRIVSVVEATTVNAVAKITLEFFRTARELTENNLGDPVIDGSIITFDRDSSENEFIQTVRAAGIHLDVIPERRRFDLGVLPALKSIIEQRQPDIVITQSIKSHFLMWRSRLWKKIPWIAYHHGYTTTDSKMRLYNRFDRWSLPKADLVLTVCEAFAQELVSVNKLSREKILVQHNPIRPGPKPDPANVKALRARLGIAEHERVILSVGRLSKEKAQADLILAIQQLCRTNADYKLVIVGDGPERANLEALASPFEKRIVFTGQISDVRPFYAMADVFVLPSQSEGSPNVLLEAMVAEIPVVATAVGGVPEIVENETSALLVSSKEPRALAAAIRRLLADNELTKHLTESATALAFRNHSPEVYVRSLIEINQEIIEGRDTSSGVEA
jgi:glycosyltransferase involved in cell wall biosynthesis